MSDQYENGDPSVIGPSGTHALEYEQLRTTGGAVWLARDVVRVQGTDAASFLQGQLSQDVAALQPGATATAWSWILQPHGKVDALVRVTRVEGATFVVDVDRGWGGVVMDRLRRFAIRVAVTIESLPWKVLALRGDVAASVRIEHSREDLVGPRQLVVDATWGGMHGVDLLGDDLEVPAGWPLCSAAAYDVLRIEEGIPRMGAELDERTIPTEADINDRTISFEKGCYTGQELVARIDARGGQVPRHLRLVYVDGAEYVPVGSKILSAADPHERLGSKVLGVVSSSAFSSRTGGVVALSMIRREVMVPSGATVLTDEGSFPCRIEGVSR